MTCLGQWRLCCLFVWFGRRSDHEVTLLYIAQTQLTLTFRSVANAISEYAEVDEKIQI